MKQIYKSKNHYTDIIITNKNTILVLRIKVGTFLMFI